MLSSLLSKVRSDDAPGDLSLISNFSAWHAAVQALLEECRSGDVLSELGFSVALALADVGLCNLNLATELQKFRRIPGVRRWRLMRRVNALEHQLEESEQALRRLDALLVQLPGEWPQSFRRHIERLLE